jgi:L-asparagine oxygenase
VLSGPADAPEICLSANGVRPLTRAAAEALKALHVACRRVCEEVRLAAGEALVLDNRKCVHGRSAFSARHDGTDRWVRRAHVRRDLWPVRDRRSPQAPRVH